uniref:Uncharacterized protein n=1 Tax=Fusarium oxysporum (strain Fo5176) TaxID=660025 RepID=A0A0D2XNW5_FUSOF
MTSKRSALLIGTLVHNSLQRWSILKTVEQVDEDAYATILHKLIESVNKKTEWSSCLTEVTGKQQLVNKRTQKALETNLHGTVETVMARLRGVDAELWIRLTRTPNAASGSRPDILVASRGQNSVIWSLFWVMDEAHYALGLVLSSGEVLKRDSHAGNRRWRIGLLKA